jgi:hypothetical protein
MATDVPVTSNDFYVWFYLTLKNWDTLATDTILITNRTLGAALSDTDSEHYPILENISGIGSTLADFLPRQTTGTISLNIKPHSFAYERRLIDLFERYTPIEQSITIYATLTRPDTPLTDPSATGTAVLKSKVRNWEVSFERNQMSLGISFDPIGNRALGYQINATDNPDATQASLGRTLPIVLGENVEAQAFTLNSDSTEPDFAFASNFGDDFEVKAVNSVKFKNRAGVYVPFANGNDAAAVLSDSYTLRADATSFTWTITAVGTQEKAWFAWEIDSSNLSSGYLINRLEITCLSLGAGSTNNQNLTCGIYSKPAGDVPNPEPLGQSTINSDDYTAQITAASGTSYTATFIFDPPVAMEPNKDHYMALNFYAEEPVDFYWGSINGTGTVQSVDYYYRNADLNENAWRFLASSLTGGAGNLPRPQYKIYGVEYTPNLSTSNKNETGFGYSYISFTQYGTPKAVLSDESFIVNCDGIADDGSGTITGSASQLIEDPADVFKLLTCEYDGTNWNVNADVDVSTYSTGLDALAADGVKVAGRTSGRDSITTTLRNLLYSTACRVGITSSGITLYPVGYQPALSGTISDENARLLELRSLSAEETIVNKFLVNYGQQLSSNEFYAAANENDLRDFVGYLLRDDATLSSQLDNSESLFGIRELGNNKFFFAATEAHALEVIERYAGVYGRKPVQLITFEVPYISFPSLEVFQVYDFRFPQMPAYFGTSSDAYPPTYDRAVVNEGKFTEKRLQKYRGQIESKKLFLTDNQAPFWRCTARIALDSQDPIWG